MGGIWLKITHLQLNPLGGIKEVDRMTPTFWTSHPAYDFISGAKLKGGREGGLWSMKQPR